MKKILLIAAIASMFAGEANAVVVCAAGPHRGGCVVRPGYGYHPYARPYGYHPYARPYGYRSGYYRRW
jgi:hypothetical protein